MDVRDCIPNLLLPNSVFKASEYVALFLRRYQSQYSCLQAVTAYLEDPGINTQLIEMMTFQLTNQDFWQSSQLLCHKVQFLLQYAVFDLQQLKLCRGVSFAQPTDDRPTPSDNSGDSRYCSQWVAI